MSLNLPGWLVPLLPDPKPSARIAVSDGVYSVTAPDGTVTEYSDLETAYDYVERELNLDVRYDDSITEGEDGMFPTAPTENPRHRRLLIAFDDQDHISLLENKYRTWTKAANRYLSDPQSFPCAYRFVNDHPVFWTRPESEADEQTFNWFGDYARRLWMMPSFDHGKTTWMLEAGAHVEPHYVNHYHDLRLDVYAPSVEDGFVQLAALVHKFYDLDGSERENVEYEKSDLELLLEERMAEYQESTGSNTEESDSSDG